METSGDQNNALKNSSSFVNFNKYHELAEGDNDFLLLLLQQTLIEFEIFKIKYPELVLLQDEISLGKLVHKVKPTLIMFELDEFLNDIQSNREQLKNSASDIDINNSMLKISASIDKIINELGNKILEIKILLV